MIVLYIVVWTKHVQECRQSTALTLLDQIHQSILPTTLAIDGLKTLSVHHQGLPMTKNPTFHSCTITTFQGYPITVHDSAHVSGGPQGQPMLSLCAVRVCINNVHWRLVLEWTGWKTIAGKHLLKVRRQWV